MQFVLVASHELRIAYSLRLHHCNQSLCGLRW